MLDSIISILDRRWSIRVISALGNYGELTFNQLVRRLAVTPKVLNETLKTLEARGLIERREVGNNTYYRLTKEGLELREKLIPLVSWVLEKYGSRIVADLPTCCNYSRPNKLGIPHTNKTWHL